MNTLLILSLKSWRNRALAICLTITSIALSVALLIGIERVRLGARESFSNTISGTDLIVGARGGSLQLLLYSVFHIGAASNNISYFAYKQIASDPDVAWTIPVSLGDSHRGFRVIATDENFYAHLRYHQGKALELSEGRLPKDEFDVVLGSEVAKTLHYRIGESVIITHGLIDTPFALQHKASPLRSLGFLPERARQLIEGFTSALRQWKRFTDRKIFTKLRRFT